MTVRKRVTTATPWTMCHASLRRIMLSFVVLLALGGAGKIRTNVVMVATGFPLSRCATTQKTGTLVAARRPSSIRNGMRDSNDDDDVEDSSSWNEKLQAFLDTPVFDPEKVLSENERRIAEADDDDGENAAAPPSEEGPFGKLRLWFATLVTSDYELAETLYAGLFLSFMVLVSQELFRMQLYGDRYVPFHRGGGNWFDSAL